MSTLYNSLSENEYIKKKGVLKSGLILIIIGTSILVFGGITASILLAVFIYPSYISIIVLGLTLLFPLPALIMSSVALGNKKMIRKGLVTASAVLTFIMAIPFLPTLFFAGYFILSGILALVGKEQTHIVINNNKEVIGDYKK